MEIANQQGPFLVDMKGDSFNRYNRLYYEHPFLTGRILENIFKHFQLPSAAEDIKQIRSVCKLWNELTFDSWRSTTVLKLGPPELSVRTRRQTELNPETYLPVNQYIWWIQVPADPYRLRTNKFSHFTVNNIDFCTLPDVLKVYNHRRACSHDNNSINLWTAFEIFEITITSFKFENCIFRRNKLDQFREILTEKLWNVKELILKDNILMPPMFPPVIDSVERERTRYYLETQQFKPLYVYLTRLEVYGDAPLDLAIFLIHSPMLKVLKIRSYDYSFIFSTMFRALMFPGMEVGKVSFLKELRELDVINSSFFRHTMHPIGNQLREMNLPLQCITLNLEPFRVYSRVSRFDPNDTQDIENILVPMIPHYRHSLKILKVFRPPVFNVCSGTLPLEQNQMECLSELHIWGNLASTFQFLYALPHLKYLFINVYCEELAEEFKTLYLANGDRQFVRLFWERYNPYERDMMMHMHWGKQTTQLVLKFMQKLHLECALSSIAIQVLAGWMPGLKIFKGILGNYEFSAVCRHFKKINELGILYKSSVEENVLIGRGREAFNRDNITSFKHLKRFLYHAYCNHSVIGDQFVYQGLLKLGSLQAVDIHVSEQMSRTAEMALKQSGISSVTVTRNYGSNSHGDGECCRRLAFANKTVWPK